MGYLLPARAYVKTLDSNETVSCGSISVTTTTELSAIRVLLYKHGTEGGTERLRARVYRDSAKTELAWTGDWSNLSDIDGLTTRWWGWLSLSFSRPFLVAGATYYVTVESDNYTRNGDTFYLALSLDWPNPQYATTAATRKGIALQIYGYRDVT